MFFRGLKQCLLELISLTTKPVSTKGLTKAASRINARSNTTSSISVALILGLTVFNVPFLLNDGGIGGFLKLAHAQTFADPIKITNLEGDQLDSHIASFGDNVYIVFSSNVGGSSDVLFMRSTDGGVQFSAPIPVSEDGPFSFLPDIAVDENGIIYVVWTSVTTEVEVVFAKSTDGGLSFTDPVRISDGVNSRSPVVAVNGDNIYVAYLDRSDPDSSATAEIFFTESADGGISFSDPINISNTPGFVSRSPSITASESNVYVVWTESAVNGLNSQTFYTKRTTGGMGFDLPVQVSSPESLTPHVAASSDNVYIVWSEFDQSVGEREVFLIISTNGGTNFGEPIDVSKSPGIISSNPNIDADGDNLAIGFEERDPSSQNPNWDVFFSGSTDGGLGLSESLNVSPDNSVTNEVLNDISLSGTNVYSTWSTLDNGNNDIYFVSGVLEETNNPPLPPPDSVCIESGDGKSEITGTEGSDTLIGTSGKNTIRGLGGNDAMHGCGGVDDLIGGLGNDGISGGPGKDLLIGDEGNDTLIGGTAMDTMEGGPGDDILAGGEGKDVFRCGTGIDTIEDFNPTVDVKTFDCENF